MSFSAKNEQIVEKFFLLKNEIDQLISIIDDDEKYLQNYLALTWGPVHSYTEAIIILCKNGKYNAAHALLRCLFEAHINIIYHQLGDSKKKLAISAKKQLEANNTITQGLLNVVTQYPTQADSVPGKLLNVNYLRGTLDETNHKLDTIIRSNSLTNLDREISLIRKALDCDQFGIENAEPGHFQLMYEMVYRYLSPYVHLDIQGLEYFIERGTSGDYVFKEVNSEDLLIGQSIGISLALIRDLYDNFVIKGEKPEIIFELEKLLKAES